MIPGLSSLFSNLKELTGKNFLMVGFFPVLVLACFSFVASRAVFPATDRYLVSVSRADATLDQLLVWFALLLAAASLGFVFWSLNSFFREILEGRFLPEDFSRWLESLQQSRREALRKQNESIGWDVHRFRGAVEKQQWINTLKNEAARGEKKGGPVVESCPEIDSRIRQLRDAWARREPIGYEDAERVFDLLKSRLESGPAAESLNRAKIDFLFEICPYALTRSESELAKIRTEKDLHFPAETGVIGANGLANMSLLQSAYAERRYGLEAPELAFPRLVKFVKKDAEFSAIFEEAKLQLDFAVAMTMAAVIFTLTWTGVAVWAASSFLPVFLILTGGYAATTLFYYAARRAARVFGELWKAALDFFRIDLLKAFGLQPPKDSDEERAIWKSLSGWLLRGDGEKLVYKPPKPPTEGASKEEGAAAPKRSGISQVYLY